MMLMDIPARIKDMPRILVVDDDAGILQLLKYVLEDAGYLCTACSGVEDGLAAMRDTTFQLVLTDIVMPDREGIEFIREIRANAPAQPIVAMSGTSIGKYDVLNMAGLLGATATLSKPFRQQQLLSVIGALIGPAPASH
jgi:DNA-binding response OmpR family regulator